MVGFHGVLGQLLGVVALAGGICGLISMRHQRLAGVAGQFLSLTHVLVAGAGLFGLVSLAGPGAPSDPLHARVYGPAMLLVLAAAWAYRTRNPRQNMLVFSVAALLVGMLALRAIATS